MGSVWAARLSGVSGFEKLFAVKMILPGFARDSKFRRMFIDEARIAGLLEHPNVAQTFELAEEGEVLYQVMEWIEGDSLQELAKTVHRNGEWIPQGIILRIVSDACRGLHAAHELTDNNGKAIDLVHRDFSPQNILVSARGQAKLIDFGIAKLKGDFASETTAGSIKGKTRYMAPEQALAAHVDRRTDVWAAGAVLRALTMSEDAYDGSDVDVLRALISGTPPRPVTSEVPPPVAAVIERAMRVNADERFATADALADAIELAMTAANLVTSNADVASYLTAKLGSRAQHRQKLLAEARRALAGGRASVPQFADSPGTPVQGGVNNAVVVGDGTAILNDGARVGSAKSLHDGSTGTLSAIGLSPRRSATPLVGVSALILACSLGYWAVRSAGSRETAAPGAPAASATSAPSVPSGPAGSGEPQKAALVDVPSPPPAAQPVLQPSVTPPPATAGGAAKVATTRVAPSVTTNAGAAPHKPASGPKKPDGDGLNELLDQHR